MKDREDIDLFLNETLPGYWAQMGVADVSAVSFARVAQRMALVLNELHGLTFTALSAGLPGRELDDPAAIPVPDHFLPEQAQILKKAAEQAAVLLEKVREDIAANLDLPVSADGRLDFSETAKAQPVREFIQALYDEAQSLLLGGDKKALEADLSMVLQGLLIPFRESPDPAAVQPLRFLVERLPEKREAILADCLAHCSEAQAKELGRL